MVFGLNYMLIKTNYSYVLWNKNAIYSHITPLYLGYHKREYMNLRRSPLKVNNALHCFLRRPLENN